jgi:hypothetical protein
VSRRARRILGFIIMVMALGAVAAAVVGQDGGTALPAGVLTRDRPAHAVPIAVLGDSNSHSFQDGISFAPGSPERGGALRPRTYNWGDVLARLRGQELDLGPWVAWGSNGVVARVRQKLGLNEGRMPRKEDYLYNFANSGAICNDLTQGRWRQAPRLAALMDREPERWRNGLLVIRMGLNDWQDKLALQARDPQAPPLHEAIDRCSTRIGEAIALVRRNHPGVRVLVVGIGNEIDDPEQFDHFQSAVEVQNIDQALARFNGALRQLAEHTPQTAFFDDDAWFKQRWGSRDAQGRPDYRTLVIGDGLRVTNTAGDAPTNALVGDHHAGLVWNALWAQSLVERLREAFGLPLTPIGDEEMWRFLKPLVQPQAGVAGPISRVPGS